MKPDYTLNFTLNQFAHNFGFEFTGEGWYHADNMDTMLCTMRAGIVSCHVWNTRDPREEWKKLLSLPNRNEGPIVVA